MRTVLLLTYVALSTWACSDDGSPSPSATGGVSSGGASGASGSATGGSAATGQSGQSSGGLSSGGLGTGGANATGGASTGGASSGGASGAAGASSGSVPVGKVTQCYGNTCPLDECDNSGVGADVRCADVYPGPVGAGFIFCASGTSGDHCLTVAGTDAVAYWSVSCANGAATIAKCASGCRFAEAQATCH